MDKLKYIDIFAGCGGLSLGLCAAGFSGVFAVEKNEDAFATFKYNLLTNHTHFEWPQWLPINNYDINILMKTYEKELKSLSGTIKLVAGGPPCQGFSMAGKRNSQDGRNKLVKSYVKFIRMVQPEAIIFENVHGFTLDFTSKDTKNKKYSDYIINALRRAGYKSACKIINMSEYGVPQTRKRFILVAMKGRNPNDVFKNLEENKDEFLKKKNIVAPVKVSDAIDDLKKSHGTIQSPDSKNFKAGLYGEILCSYQKMMREKSKENVNIAVDSHRFVNHTKDIVELHKELQKKAPRGKRITPADGLVKNLKRRGVTVLDKELPAPTITSIPDELVHYDEPRILTVQKQVWNQKLMLI